MDGAYGIIGTVAASDFTYTYHHDGNLCWLTDAVLTVDLNNYKSPRPNSVVSVYALNTTNASDIRFMAYVKSLTLIDYNKTEVRFTSDPQFPCTGSPAGTDIGNFVQAKVAFGSTFLSLGSDTNFVGTAGIELNNIPATDRCYYYALLLHVYGGSGLFPAELTSRVQLGAQNPAFDSLVTRQWAVGEFPSAIDGIEGLKSFKVDTHCGVAVSFSPVGVSDLSRVVTQSPTDGGPAVLVTPSPSLAPQWSQDGDIWSMRENLWNDPTSDDSNSETYLDDVIPEYSQAMDALIAASEYSQALTVQGVILHTNGILTIKSNKVTWIEKGFTLSTNPVAPTSATAQQPALDAVLGTPVTFAAKAKKLDAKTLGGLKSKLSRLKRSGKTITIKLISIYNGQLTTAADISANTALARARVAAVKAALKTAGVTATVTTSHVSWNGTALNSDVNAINKIVLQTTSV